LAVGVLGERSPPALIHPARSVRARWGGCGTSLSARRGHRQGEPLWPWFQSAVELEKIEQLEPRDFAALYQQDPIGEGGTEWAQQYSKLD
jgi:hypothetical protein